MKVCQNCSRQYDDGMLELCPDDGGMLFELPDAKRLLGVTIDERFLIREVIGEGAMGQVYLASQTSMDREIALKVILPELTVSQNAVARFLREAKAVSKMSHPNAITVYDFGRTREGLLYLAMEYIKGHTLNRVLKKRGKFSLADAAHIIIQICSALEQAHNLGIVHRDLKPDNIMLTNQPGHRYFVKVLDFGLAKMLSSNGEELFKTRSGMLCGTPMYMSPEQALSKPVDHRSDIYSMALIFFQMLTGRPVFDGKDSLSLVVKHARETPPTISEVDFECKVPPDLELLILQCLAKDPDKRPQSATEVRRRVKQCLVDAAQHTGSLRNLVSGDPSLFDEPSGMGLEEFEDTPSVDLQSESTERSSDATETAQTLNRARRALEGSDSFDDSLARTYSRSFGRWQLVLVLIGMAAVSVLTMLILAYLDRSDETSLALLPPFQQIVTVQPSRYGSPAPLDQTAPRGVTRPKSLTANPPTTSPPVATNGKTLPRNALSPNIPAVTVSPRTRTPKVNPVGTVLLAPTPKTSVAHRKKILSTTARSRPPGRSTRVTVVVVPADATVYLGSKRLKGRSPHHLRLSQGTLQQLTVRRRGYHTRKKSFKTLRSATQTVKCKLSQLRKTRNVTRKGKEPESRGTLGLPTERP